MATLTAAGINCSNGTLDGQYTGTSAVNTTFPIGTYVFCQSSPAGGAVGAVYVNSTMPYVKTNTAGGLAQSAFYTSSQASVSGFSNLSGTWRLRGSISHDDYNVIVYGGLVQRVA
jgi:hypothetical protein